MPSLAFVLSSLIVIVSPGPDLVLISQFVLGRPTCRPAFAAAAGMVLAGAGHAVAGFAGLAVVLHTDPALYTAVRVAGAGVLVRWAFTAWRSAWRPGPAAGTADAAPRRAFLRGFLCTATNPKVGLFLVAFLPQFVPAGQEPLPAFALLAGTYLALVALWLSVWTLTARRIRPLLLAARTRRVVDVVLGLVFVSFALRLAVSG